jgi:hypothetical protein
MSNYNEFNNQNYNTNINPNADNNFINNMTNENFINMASSIDLETLNGTNIMDLNRDANLPIINNSSVNMPSFNSTPSFNNMPSFNSTQMNNLPPLNNIQTFNNLPQLPINNLNLPLQINSRDTTKDKDLVRSITKELINNFRENNISLHDDNGTYNSNYSKKNKISNLNLNMSDDDINSYVTREEYMNAEGYDNTDGEAKDTSKIKKSKKIHEYKDELKRGLEHVMSENGVPNSPSVTSYIFDDLFNIKEFIILFGVYFLLSQEMVKDLFAQYFTSLNPDDTGRVHVKGVIIYGLILTVLFMVFKKIL